MCHFLSRHVKKKAIRLLFTANNFVSNEMTKIEVYVLEYVTD